MTSRIIFVREPDPHHYQISSLYTHNNNASEPAGGAEPESMQRNSSARSRKRADEMTDNVCLL
ncbi:MAG: hypothetical protein DI535_03980 [Citrobacter freundii]|nr:MAG: hypothetical protein DI535_03980 [Citrobacter freundii]